MESQQGDSVSKTCANIEADSLSPDSGGASEPERAYLKAKEEYESRLAQLQEQYDEMRQERVWNLFNLAERDLALIFLYQISFRD